ncbi:hypothetical protein JCGZ_22248 [Jatropha curcas]|uniref:Uncharacterized protein n=1 Tax=Jatropha curcas TaxID=180498 RepID=A0A067JSL4_JATCU|nr:hypothetical protein JCGZ_22248 [Jatropha curcas]
MILPRRASLETRRPVTGPPPTPLLKVVGELILPRNLQEFHHLTRNFRRSSNPSSVYEFGEPVGRNQAQQPLHRRLQWRFHETEPNIGLYGGEMFAWWS